MSSNRSKRTIQWAFRLTPTAWALPASFGYLPSHPFERESPAAYLKLLCFCLAVQFARPVTTSGFWMTNQPPERAP